MPTFIHTFALSLTDRGLVNSAFFWTYAVLQIPGLDFLVDRYGIKVPYALGFLIWCIASATTAFTHSIRELVLVQILFRHWPVPPWHPASYRWIRYHFAEKERGLAIALYTMGTKIGPAIGTPLTAFLIGRYGLAPADVRGDRAGRTDLAGAPWLEKVVKNDGLGNWSRGFCGGMEKNLSPFGKDGKSGGLGNDHCLFLHTCILSISVWHGLCHVLYGAAGTSASGRWASSYSFVVSAGWHRLSRPGWMGGRSINPPWIQSRDCPQVFYHCGILWLPCPERLAPGDIAGDGAAIRCKVSLSRHKGWPPRVLLGTTTRRR